MKDQMKAFEELNIGLRPYEKDGVNLLTQCPVVTVVKIGSAACTRCHWFKGINETTHHVLCGWKQP